MSGGAVVVMSHSSPTADVSTGLSIAVGSGIHRPSAGWMPAGFARVRSAGGDCLGRVAPHIDIVGKVRGRRRSPMGQDKTGEEDDRRRNDGKNGGDVHGNPPSGTLRSRMPARRAVTRQAQLLLASRRRGAGRTGRSP